MLTQKQKALKRLFDVFLTFLCIPLLAFPTFIIIVLASISTKSSGIFSQIRIGKDGRPFTLYKIRTLRGAAHSDIVEMKKSETPFGTWLRKTKLDELPQLFNVLLGDMSWVGPRPDVPGYADTLEGEDRKILLVRPGITGPATLKYKNEETVLLQQDNPSYYNDTVIWPDKVKINREYVENWSFKKDIQYLWQSIFG